jgi:alanine racemase
VEGEPRPVVGTISMDALAVELDRQLPVGTPVTLLGDGVMAERSCPCRRHDQLRARLRDQQRSRSSRRVVVDS